MYRFTRTRVRALVGASAAVALATAVFATLGASGATSASAAQYGPVNESLPAVSGNPQDNSVLVATTGTWKGDVKSYSYQWQLCDGNGANCKDLGGGAKSSTYGVTSHDVGGRIRVVVTAHAPDGSSSAAASQPTAVVTRAGSGGGSATSGCTNASQVAVSQIAPPIRLLIDKWQFDPGVVNLGTHTIVARVHVTDTCNQSVSGVNVWGTAIPYNQVSTEQSTTGGDGWATLTFNVQSGFPANPGRQQILAMLFRGTDPHGSTLAGKSTRRVVRLNVNVS